MPVNALMVSYFFRHLHPLNFIEGTDETVRS